MTRFWLPVVLGWWDVVNYHGSTLPRRRTCRTLVAAVFAEFCPTLRESPRMVSSAITPTRTIAVLIGIAVLAVAGFAVVRSGVFNPGSVQGAIPGPGTTPASPSASISASKDPSASPSTSPSPTTPEQIKQKNIADAKARLVEFYEATARVANSGYSGWEDELLPFWGRPQIWQPMSDLFEGYRRDGRYTTGAATVESIRVAGYRDDKSGFEDVTLHACVDFSRVTN